jgi:hypothetical protein
MQLCFVSVHDPRETYFVDEPRRMGIQWNTAAAAAYTECAG